MTTAFATPPRETIIPKSQDEWLALRTQDVTSTEVAALFGISPYITAFELWNRKKNATYVKLEENERMKWGTRLQDSIAAGVAEDQQWKIRRMDEYVRDPVLKIGSSFDFEVLEPANGLLEIKNVDSLMFRDGWIADDNYLEAPPHIELQVQHQLLVSRKPVAHIGALIGGNKIVLVKREPDPKIALAIMDKVAKFWASIEANDAPAPDFRRDADFIASLYSYAEPGKIFDASENSTISAAALAYREYGEQIKELDAKRDELKAQILTQIGDAEKVIGPTFSISAGLIGPKHIEYDRKGYRDFKISWKKVKETK